MSACDALTFEHKQRGRGVLSDSVLTSNFIIIFLYIYQVGGIFWDRPLLTASVQVSSLTADFKMYFDVKDTHCEVNED